MKLSFTNLLWVKLFVFVFVLSLLRRCARGLEQRHGLLRRRAPREHGSELHHVPGAKFQTLPPYLRLPEFLDSREPLVDPEHFEPSAGTGEDPLPEPVLELLRPSSTEPPPAEPQPEASVRIDCKHEHMFVEVDRAVLGSSDPKTTLRLGNCTSTKDTEDYVSFELELTECGTVHTTVNDQVVYSNVLDFQPEETHSPIRRAAPFTLDLSCLFNRYHYLYKMAYVPKLVAHNLFKRMRNREKFTLTPKNAQWEPLSPSDAFTLGMPMFFEAQTEMLSSEQRLYLHSCFATAEPSSSSTPSFNVVSNYGCMVESKNGLSSFIHSTNNAVRFSVNAFVFPGLEGNTLYMHCTMSVGPYSATATDKSCIYHPDTKSWVELNGSETVCSCCESTCGTPASPEAVISSKPWNIKVKPKASAKKKRPKTSGAKRKSKSPSRVSRLKPVEPEERPEGGASEPISESVRWAVAEAEPVEVAGSAVVEEIKEPEKEQKYLIFEDVFGLNQDDPPHNEIKG